MKLPIVCDFCGCTFMREKSLLKGKKHHFCSLQCRNDFSSKSKNPNGYFLSKDFTNISAHMTELNKKLNPTRMTPRVREKLRISRLNSGKGITYTKTYGIHTHRVVAEQILGRPLMTGEVVHHIDGNKRNNEPSNIKVFSSQAEHARFHIKLNEVLKMLNS